MVAMNDLQPTPPQSVGKGAKYDMVVMLLKHRRNGVTVEDWIRAGREEGHSYNRLSDELNAMLREEYGEDNTPRLTFESIRRWDPDGEFQRAATRAQTTRADAAGPPPVHFRAPETTMENE
jgi:hypothetical protein